MFDKIVEVKRTKFYLVETTIAIVLLLAINIIFLPSKPAFEGINPNPLWVVVLAISGRYGRNGALFSSIMASAYFVIYYMIIESPDVFLEDLWLLRYPFFFILIGFLIGEIKTVFILREDYLTNRVQELENHNEKLSTENEITREAHKNLTTDVATTQDTITMLNSITSRLKSLNAQDVYQGILDSFKDYLNAEECSFYAYEGNLLTLQKSLGWKDYYRRPESYEVGKGMIGIVAEEKETLSIKDIVLKKRDLKGKESDIMGDTLLAIPVLGIENKLYGVASIEKLPLTDLTDSTIQAARITCELAASSLNTAYSVLALKEQHIKDENYDLYKYHYFVSRLDEEYLRSLNYMLPLSIMGFNWPKLYNVSDEKTSTIFKSVIELIKTNLRAFDVLAKGPISEVPLVLLLATTPGPQAEGFKEKIITKIEEYGFEKIISDKKLQDTITVVDFSPNKVGDAKEMLKKIGL